MKQSLPFIILLLVMMALPLFMYRVNESEQVVVTVFGKPAEEAIFEPGLRFRMPWWKVNRFEKRIVRWDGDARSPLNTSERTFIYLDTTARWRIDDPLLFYTSVKTISNARLRLDDIIDSVVRTSVSNNRLIEFVRNSNRTPQNPESEVDEIDEETRWNEIEKGRELLMDQVLTEASPILYEKMGIELIDVRVKRLNYVENVQSKIFERMIAERRRIAQRYRSEGEGEAANIIGSMERELKEITSEAYRKAQEIEGQADAEAIQIYADAFSRDPEFYSFQQTLNSYESTMNKGQKRMILTTDSEYFRFLKETRSRK